MIQREPLTIRGATRGCRPGPIDAVKQGDDASNSQRPESGDAGQTDEGAQKPTRSRCDCHGGLLGVQRGVELNNAVTSRHNLNGTAD